MSRWAKAGVLNALVEQLQRLKHVPIKVLSLDSSIVKVHPDGTEAPKKNGPQAIGKSRGGWSTKLHLVAASACDVLLWSLTPGQAGDAPEGRQLIQAMGPQSPGQVALLMDSAYQREVARQLGFVPVVPPSPQRCQPWPLDKMLYRRRNEVDIMFAAFITCALIAELLR